MSLPGVVISGLRRRSAVTPHEENEEILTEPTPSMLSTSGFFEVPHETAEEATAIGHL